MIINPQARRGGAAQGALQVLRGSGFEIDLQTVGVGEGDLEEVLAAEVARGASMAVVGGGDGTLSRAVKPLMHSSTALGVLPLGTGNTFARNLGVPLDLAQAARVIAARRARRVDVGLVNGRPFLNSVSLGLSAQIAASLTRDLKRRLGWLAYAVVGGQALARRSAFGVRAVLDGQEVTLFTSQLVIANAVDVADALLVPGADLEDGDLVLLALPGATRAATVLSALRWRMGDLSAVRSRRFHRGVITLSEGALSANVDGEVQQQGQFTFEVRGVRRALRVLTPGGPLTVDKVEVGSPEI